MYCVLSSGAGLLTNKYLNGVPEARAQRTASGFQKEFLS